MILVKLLSLIWWYFKDLLEVTKKILGITLIIGGMIALAFVFPYILILYVIGIGGALVGRD